MEMKMISKKYELCTCCMEEHDVETVQVLEHNIFKNKEVEYLAEYQYCSVADELYATEAQIQKNDIAMKDAYRTAISLLTSKEIREIRETYGITQKDLCVLLGWGEKTITRYESYQVQDKAHDTILKKLAQDPEWFIQLLAASNNLISEENYKKYQEKAMNLYDSNRDIYLKKAIQGKYYSLSEEELEIWNIVIENLCKMTTSNIVDVVDFMHREKAYQETLM